MTQKIRQHRGALGLILFLALVVGGTLGARHAFAATEEDQPFSGAPTLLAATKGYQSTDGTAPIVTQLLPMAGNPEATLYSEFSAAEGSVDVHVLRWVYTGSDPTSAASYTRLGLSEVVTLTAIAAGTLDFGGRYPAPALGVSARSATHLEFRVIDVVSGGGDVRLRPTRHAAAPGGVP